MIIRAAEPDDAPAICDIWNPLIRDTTVTFTNEVRESQEISTLIKVRLGVFSLLRMMDKLFFFTKYSSFRGGPDFFHRKNFRLTLPPMRAVKGWACAFGTTGNARN